MCHRLCSTEVLLGIISFSPAKGRGEVTRLLMTVVFQRGCFSAGCAAFPGCFPLETKPFPRWVWAAVAEGVKCGVCCSLTLLGSGHPSSLSLPLGYSQTQPCPCSVTPGAPWAPAGPQEPLLAGRRQLSWRGASFMKGSWEHKGVPGFLLSCALKQ